MNFVPSSFFKYKILLSWCYYKLSKNHLFFKLILITIQKRQDHYMLKVLPFPKMISLLVSIRLILLRPNVFCFLKISWKISKLSTENKKLQNLTKKAHTKGENCKLKLKVLFWCVWELISFSCCFELPCV